MKKCSCKYNISFIKKFVFAAWAELNFIILHCANMFLKLPYITKTNV